MSNKPNLSSREVIKVLKKNGWIEVKSNSGSHIQFKHNKLKGRVTVPHPKKIIVYGTLKSIAIQSNIQIEEFYKWFIKI